jgi:membrane protein
METMQQTLGLFWTRRMADLRELIATLKVFPWRNTAHVLRERFREDRLGLTASSLTFTTTIALVPLFTVALAIFTAFPIFAKMQGVLQQWLIESLVPDNIARNVLGYLTQFASKASRLGAVGLALLLASALALIFTIDRTLNNIWRVRRSRPFAQRLLVYWAALTLGPVLLAGSLTLTSYALSLSKGVVGILPGGLRVLIDVLEFVLLAGGMAMLYRFVPNTRVLRAHAWSGGVFVALGFMVAKKLLAVYLASVPSYSAIYGAFATVPIMLLWIYIAWVIVLLGAVIAAYLPSLLQGVQRRGGTPGWRFQLCIEIIQHLHRARTTPAKGLTIAQLGVAMQVDALQIEPVMAVLSAQDYASEIADGSGRYVMLCEPEQIAMASLVEKLLLATGPSVQGFLNRSSVASLNGRDVLLSSEEI